jgi:hypothetical protein
VLDGLVRRAVFADADGIVGEDVDHGDFHQGCQADGRARKIGEDEEAAAVRADFGQGHAVEAGAHGQFADAEVEIAAGPGEGLGAVLVDEMCRQGPKSPKGLPSLSLVGPRRVSVDGAKIG